METYLTDIASLKLKPRSLDDYWSKTRNDIVPGIGRHRLDKLAPEHLEKMYRVMLDEGHAPSHVLKVHRILSRALKIAHRRRMIVENVATLVDPPAVDETEANPFTTDEAKAFLQAAAKRPNFLRWCVGVGMGFRQEKRSACGGRTSTSKASCSTPVADSAPYVAPWLQGRARLRCSPSPLRALPAGLQDAQELHARLPQPCTKTCTRHASACPERKGGGLVFTRPKTKKSTNPVPIPPPFVPYLREHKARQEEMRAAAGEEWQEHKAVFTRPDGRPLDPEPTGRNSRIY